MIGNNTFVLNQATMIEALQMYLNAKMVHAPTVTSVKATGGSQYDNTFTVSTDGGDGPAKTEAA